MVMSDVPSPGGAIDAPASNYWTESRRPLASLLFVAPLLALYEVGVLALGDSALRNGADVWLRQLLEWIGLGHYFLLPALTVGLLIAWHYTTRGPWRVSRGVLAGMALESAAMAVSLRLLLEFQAAVVAAIGPAPAAAAAPLLDLRGALTGIVGYLGAGVYEELLFRLIPLMPIAWALGRWGVERRRSLAAAIAATSFAFAAAHYVGPYGESVSLVDGQFWFSFTFRLMAGALFGVLFVYRGFGIAAGTHAGYDILAGAL
jgi:hypothetical protein